MRDLDARECSFRALQIVHLSKSKIEIVERGLELMRKYYFAAVIIGALQGGLTLMSCFDPEMNIDPFLIAIAPTVWWLAIVMLFDIGKKLKCARIFASTFSLFMFEVCCVWLISAFTNGLSSVFSITSPLLFVKSILIVTVLLLNVSLQNPVSAIFALLGAFAIDKVAEKYLQRLPSCSNVGFPMWQLGLMIGTYAMFIAVCYDHRYLICEHPGFQ